MQLEEPAGHQTWAPSRRPDTLSSKIALLKELSPPQMLRFLQQLAWAKWSLRRATSVGKYVKVVGRLRVTNEGRLVVGDRVLLRSHVATTELAVPGGGELRIGDGAFVNYGAEICATKLVDIGKECRIGT